MKRVMNHSVALGILLFGSSYLAVSCAGPEIPDGVKIVQYCIGYCNLEDHDEPPPPPPKPDDEGKNPDSTDAGRRRTIYEDNGSPNEFQFRIGSEDRPTRSERLIVEDLSRILGATGSGDHTSVTNERFVFAVSVAHTFAEVPGGRAAVVSALSNLLDRARTTRLDDTDVKEAFGSILRHYVFNLSHEASATLEDLRVVIDYTLRSL